ncbi:MAG: GAF domain-containing protein [Euryhalocaulis sp.]|uniref:GAF domain-containing protein n=1 Tax=Euryhalocaulis sp. TaxID=2744307 RepID=UPI00181A850E|nr:GAF domain-containing protein [Euryhalocaulis sp.]MBA4802137.1 GAF domain-containing protein [Euryhalocaulis sp.]
MTYPTPPDEAGRQAALESFGILDTPATPEFDRLTRLATAAFDAPIALVSLLDKDRQWFKSCIGLHETSTPRDVAFCAHAILSDEGLVVPDAKKDSRFANNPLVTGTPFIRFYAGAPLITDEGYRLGTFCIIDNHARDDLSRAERAMLRDLADLAMETIERGASS